MAERILMLQVRMTISDLDESEFAIAREGAIDFGDDGDDDEEVDVAPALDNEQVHELEASELGLMFADHLETNDPEIWAGSGIYAKITKVVVVGTGFED